MILCRKKILNFVIKEFIISPIHALCSHFKESSRWEVGAAMRCLVTKSSEMRFFAVIFRLYGGVRETFAAERVT